MRISLCRRPLPKLVLFAARLHSLGRMSFWRLRAWPLVALGTWNGGTSAWQRPTPSKLKAADIPFNGERAYQYLQELCAIGPRVSGTEGMQRQQAYLKAHFEKMGGRVTLQEFDARHPQTGMPVRLANLIVEWHPERKERVLL